MSMNVRLKIYKIITKSEYFFTSNVDWFPFIYILTITIHKFVNGTDVKFEPSKGNKRAINEQRIFLTIDNRKLPRFEIVYWTYDESGKILMSIKCSRSKNIFFKQMKGNTSKAEAKVKWKIIRETVITSSKKLFWSNEEASDVIFFQKENSSTHSTYMSTKYTWKMV